MSCNHLISPKNNPHPCGKENLKGKDKCEKHFKIRCLWIGGKTRCSKNTCKQSRFCTAHKKIADNKIAIEKRFCEQHGIDFSTGAALYGHY